MLQKLLRNPILPAIGVIIGFISLIIAFIGLLITIYSNFLKPDAKALQVVYSVNTSPVEVQKSTSTANLSEVQVKLENIGNQPIVEGDYERPIAFIFTSTTEIITASVLGSDPPNIGISILRFTQNTATLSKTLLNPKDHAVIRFLVANMPSQGNITPFEVDTHINGVRKISVIRAVEPSNRGGRGTDR